MNNKEGFIYASRILRRRGVSIDDKSSLKKVVEGEIRYGSLPVNEESEFRKGLYFEDQAQFVKSHKEEELLCEVLDNDPCRQKQCPMFLPEDAKSYPMENRHGVPLCGEFQISFAKTS